MRNENLSAPLPLLQQPKKRLQRGGHGPRLMHWLPLLLSGIGSGELQPKQKRELQWQQRMRRLQRCGSASKRKLLLQRRCDVRRQL